MRKFLFAMKKMVKKNVVVTKIVRHYFGMHRERLKRKMAAYINKNYKHLFEKYNNSAMIIHPTVEKYPVWVCWFQGGKNMPKAIKMCYASLLKNAGGHKINLITSSNYSEFADIPECIRKKYESKLITHTHFSEILRAHLLSKYGGLWIDATTYVSSELPSFDNFSYWTGRWNGGCPFSKTKQFTDFLSYCLPNDILWNFIKDFYIDYWSKHNKVIAYYILEVAILCAYENIKSVKDLTDKVPITRQGMFDLYSMANLEYNRERYESLCNEICFHKLTHKEDFKKYTKDKKQTFYGYLCQEYEKEENR